MQNPVSVLVDGIVHATNKQTRLTLISDNFQGFYPCLPYRAIWAARGQQCNFISGDLAISDWAHRAPQTPVWICKLVIRH